MTTRAPDFDLTPEPATGRSRPTRRHTLALIAGATAAPALPPSIAAAGLPVRNYVQDGTPPEVAFTYLLDGTRLTAAMPVTFANVAVDMARPDRSTIDVAMDAAAARLGLNFVDKALARPDLLHTARHPTIRFTATGIGDATGDAATVYGKLTLRGITRPVALQTRIDAAPAAPGRARIDMTGTISRAAFGATGLPGLVGDTIGLSVTSYLRAA